MFNQIREFLVLADELNYSTAAKKMFISESTLSRHIGFLEKELGCELFQRSTRFVELTEFGKIAYSRFSTIMREYETLIQDAERRSSGKHGELYVGVLTFMFAIYMPFLNYFQKKYPDITLNICTLHPVEAIRDLANGRVDIVDMPISGLPDVKQFHYEWNYKQKILVGLSEKNPLAKKEALDYKDIESKPIITMKQSASITKKVFSLAKTMPAEEIYVQNIEETPLAILKYDGITFTSESGSLVGGEGIKYLPVNDERATIDCALLYQPGNANPTIPIYLKEAAAFIKKDNRQIEYVKR